MVKTPYNIQLHEPQNLIMCHKFTQFASLLVTMNVAKCTSFCRSVEKNASTTILGY